MVGEHHTALIATDVASAASVDSSLFVLAIGEVIRIDVAGVSPAQRAAVVAAWADAVSPGGETAPAATVVVEASDDLPSMLADLSQRVTLAAIGARRGRSWMLHAAGIADDRGNVIVLVGPSGRGKTTAALALGRAYAYLSDETVAIDRDGTVWPYRKPLSIIERPDAPKAQRAPSERGLRPLPAGPLRLAGIVLLDRGIDAPDAAVLDALPLDAALADLVEQSSHLTALPAPLRTIARHVVEVGTVHRAHYREASSLPRAMATIFSAAANGDSPRRGAEPGEAHRDEVAATPAASRATIARAPYIDTITLEDTGSVAVLQPRPDGTGKLTVLAGIAPALWAAAADGASMARFLSAAEAAYGAPDHQESAVCRVEASVLQLIEAGIFEDARWRRAERVAWTDDGDRVVALSLTDSAAAPVAMEGPAGVVWRCLEVDEARYTAEVVRRVATVAALESIDVDADVRAFLGALAEAGLASSERVG
ncbi:ATP-binding protein [Microbacterium sp. P01]|uniref:ATP-binding protein n=1 Tax=unclassified Microbacterium TaxID=2609290 RepID=UPI003671CDA4